MEDLRFYLKRPDGKARKTYSIVCYRPITRTQKEYLDLPDAIKIALDNVNLQIKDKTILPHQAEVLLNELITSQYRKSKVQTLVLKNTILSEANSKILSKFWLEKYEVRYLEDGGISARSDFERTFRAIEPLSVQVASKGELQTKLKKNLKNVNQIRRASERLNEVLRYLKRDFKLEKPKKPRKEIRYLNLVDFMKASKHIECEGCRSLAVSLFVSGARIGEAMALEETDLWKSELSITKQLSTSVKGGKVKLPKREKTGTVAVLEFGIKDLKSWISEVDKWSHRWHLGKELSKACRAAKVKVISPHDLRHSHAIHLLTLGATLTEVSLNLRNRIEVCQEYYTGFAHTEGTLDRLKRLTAG